MADTPFLNPLAASKQIGDSYKRYLRSRHAPRDPQLRDEFYHALDAGFPLVRGPLLQAAAPYETVGTLEGLIDDGFLSEGLRDLPASAFPLGRPLYHHQAEAIRKLVEGRNLIVATGTGSGKTECFLFPILSHLLNERTAGTLATPGVRALLLYPMNALANDQMKRVRDIIDAFPDITFGRFIGATPNSYRDALGVYQHRFGSDPLPNELISREQIRDRPPHILLTNYAMLEYLLLRPADTKLFDGPTGRHWRFVVLDEVHVYNGARGAEIAMLLRRVRDRVNMSEPGRIQFVGTSATLGSEEEYPDLAQYGCDLFDETVEYEAHVPARQDIVAPVRRPLVQTTAIWEADATTLDAMSRLLTSGDTVPESLVAELAAMGAPTSGSSRCPFTYFGQVLATERHVVNLQYLLERGSVGLSEAAEVVFGERSVAALTDLVEACSRAKAPHTDSPVIPVRYHFLVRALEGAFICKSPCHPPGRPRLRLQRHRKCPDCATKSIDSRVFESGVCTKCGATYLVGSRNEADGHVFVRSAQPFDTNLTYLLLDKQVTLDDEDEEAIVGDDLIAAKIDNRVLCTMCGSLTEGSEPSCDCDAGAQTQVTVAHPSKRGEPLRRCLACSGRTNGPIVLRFLTGQDAPVSVIATALYQSLPPSSNPETATKIGEGRKLLSFSDSRQDAAFFAPYLDRTYSRAVERRLIWAALKRLSDSRPRFEDLVIPIRKAAEQALVLDEDAGAMQNSNRVRTWLMREVLAVDRRQSLDGVGLAEITFALPKGLTPVPALLELGFTPDETLDLARVLLETLRIQAAVHLPDGVDITDPTFAPRNVVTRVRLEQSAPNILAWLPGRGLNRRLDYLSKVLTRRDISKDAPELLKQMWQRWIAASRSPWGKVLTSVNDRRHGVLFALDPEWVTMRLATREAPAFRCTSCRQIWWRSVSGVCPTYTCEGTLKPITARTRQRDEHYLHLYTTLDPVGLRVEEHTGQLHADYAGRLQQEFLDGDINALSCSTTFELGVDVGEVQAVLMRNVPPSPANYVQRAGRAGRRSGSSALAVTFAQRRSHDIHYFDNPRALVDGHVATPIVSLTNPQIVRRHIHAAAFAAFEREHVDSGGDWHRTVASFFTDRAAEGSAPVDRFIEWLRSHPTELGAAVRRITPPELAAELGVGHWLWVEALAEESESEHYGWLKRAQNEVGFDLDELNDDLDEVSERIAEYRRKGSNQRASNLAGYQRALFGVKRTLEERQLIQFLAQRVVLPKYGFPVDVVSLDIWKQGDPGASRLNLSRDLRIGITDYAPGSRIVADKKLWEPVGFRIPAGKALLDYVWAICGNCGAFRARRGTDPAGCDVCSSRITEQSRPFVIPMFGFIGTLSEQKPGEARPPKAGYSAFHFNDYANTTPDYQHLPIGEKTISIRSSRQGQITVLNKGPRGRGFQICKTCGHAEPAPTSRTRTAKKRVPHTRPGRKSKCGTMLSSRHLGHQYLTDVVEIGLPVPMTDREARSTLYALLAATHPIGIIRNDVNGTLRSAGPNQTPSIVIFDTVPGGAGHTRRIIDRFPDLLKAASDVVAKCECGADSSCYGCLRSYDNAAYHDALVRGDALTVINQVLTP
ncbi:MAG: DEAD/DEAH box helicase [bacterium]|nr:DEAD/DEAH box helicase [bacterium]